MAAKDRVVRINFSISSLCVTTGLLGAVIITNLYSPDVLRASVEKGGEGEEENPLLTSSMPNLRNF